MTKTPATERSVPKPVFTDAEAGALEFPSWRSRTFNSANVVRQVQQTIANAKAAHAFAGFNRGWVEVVERHVGAWAHAEHGIGLCVYTPAQRDAPTNMINNALAVGATHKLRLAQALILYNLDLSESLEGFDGGAHRDAWQHDPVWLGVRENVERLTATRDWAEAFFATALIFEPLVGELFRSHFVMQVSAPQGDYVTPAVMGTGEADVAREQRGARHLFELLLNDPQHARENRALLQQWLAKWVPASVTAARQLQPVWSQVSERVVSFEDSFGRATVRFDELLDGLGLESPKEL
jgi:propane monooxygenase small subunit